MLKDINHDLIKQLSVISSSLWRIKNLYLENSKDFPECLEVWKKLEADYENHIQFLSGQIKKHIEQNKFD